MIHRPICIDFFSANTSQIFPGHTFLFYAKHLPLNGVLAKIFFLEKLVIFGYF